MLRGIAILTKYLITFVVLAIILGVTYENFSKKQAALDFPPPGQLINIGERHIHLDCRGNGHPTVVFESGLDVNGSLSWSRVHDTIAASTRACAYSRAGIMWSEPHDISPTGKTIANDLNAALKNAGEPGPFVLVGHSLGGPYIMTYTKYFRDDVAGLVFVDSSHPEQIQRIAALNLPEAGMHESTKTLYKLGAALNWTGLVRIVASFYSKHPKQPENDDLAIKAYTSTSLEAMLKEQEAIPQTLEEANTFRELGNRPLFVLSAMKPLTKETLTHLKWTDEQAKQVRNTWQQMHSEQATWSSNSQHQLIYDANHYIQLDRPDIVSEATLWVINQVRNKQEANEPNK